MSRYIKEDALIEDLDKGLWGKDYDKALAEAIIQDAPSIDIVRCKECKKCYKDTDALTKQTVLICQKHKYEFDWEKVEADDFCSWGEREGE